ncbi:MAG TPA: hypothetical protein VKZ18_04760 [Polyangia bacterium]|nr:hypothetical protein [Polyangia bacterium]
MTRTSYLTFTAFMVLLLTAFGCNDGSGVAPDGGGSGGATAAGGAAGTGKGGATGAAGTTGKGGSGVAGATGAGGTVGTGGATGTAGAAGGGGATGAAGTTGAAGNKGAAGASGAAGTTGAAGNKGAAGTTGTAGTSGGGGAGGGGLICKANQACPTLGEQCQTACSGGATSESSFCTCADQGGGQPTLACVSLACGGHDAGVTDAGNPIFHTCTAGLQDGDNCTPGTDTLCESACTNKMQMRCLCAPHGGGGGGKWTCTTGVACN